MTHPDDHPRAVIFDLDGVLVDSEGLHVAAWKELFAHRGMAVTDEEYAHGIGMTDSAWLRYLFERRGQAADIAWWQEAKRAIYRGILERNIQPFPGVVELVQRLRPDFLLGVASSSWRENIEAVLDGTGLRACFGALTGKEDVTHHKPHPEAYLRTAACLSVAPAVCTVIEDSVLGVRAAKAAGMRCIAVPNTLPAEALAEADLVVLSLEDPEPILRLARE